jgi:hypothetical protein
MAVVACSSDDSNAPGGEDATADGASMLDSGVVADGTVTENDATTHNDSGSGGDAVSDATGSDASDSGATDSGDAGHASDAGSDASDSGATGAGDASDAGSDASDSGATGAGDASDAGSDAANSLTCDDAGNCFQFLSQGTAGAKTGDVAIDTTTIYWTERSTGNIMSAPIGGGASTTIASGQATPIGIAVDSMYVYWANSAGTLGTTAGIAKAPKAGADGGAPKPFYSAYFGYRLVIDNARSTIWFVDDVGPVNGSIVSFPLADAGYTGEIEEGEGYFKAVVADPSGVYGASANGILGGTGAGGSENFLNTGAVGTPFAMVSDSTNLYYVDTGLGEVFSFAKTGANPATAIAPAGKTTDQPLAMAISGSTIYWADVATGTVKSVGTTGANLKTVVNSPATPRGIAVDLSWIYWSSDDGAVRRIAH